jgi:hypothetical protein
MNNKHFYWIIIIACILLFFSSCITEKKPAIKFENLIYNFGEVDQGKNVSYTFTYLNPGTDVLEITAVKPTCGCTVPGDFTKEVAPGEKGEFPVVFNTKGYQGYVSKTIRIETNVPDSEPVYLSMEGKINVILEVNPKRVWLGQTRKDGPPLTGTVHIKNYVDTPLKIIDATPSGERCTIKINTIKEGKEYSIDITVSPPFDMNEVRENLVITTNSKGKELITLQYHYYGIADIDVSPEEILISTEYLQPDLRRIITIKSHIDAPIEIINPRVLHGENIELALKEVEPGKQIKLVLHFTKEFEFPENETPAVSFGIKSKEGETTYTIPIKNADTL